MTGKLFEIERRFLFNKKYMDILFKHPSSKITQGYFSVNNAAIRVRIIDRKEASLAIKSSESLKRYEFEYSIPLANAFTMIDVFNLKTIVKNRFYVYFGIDRWEIDLFAGDNEGLIIAEIELYDPNYPFNKPFWLKKEITHIKKYSNEALAFKPRRK